MEKKQMGIMASGNSMLEREEEPLVEGSAE